MKDQIKQLFSKHNFYFFGIKRLSPEEAARLAQIRLNELVLKGIIEVKEQKLEAIRIL